MKHRILLVLIIGVALASCGRDPAVQNEVSSAAQDKPVIIATNYPLYYFASEIAGDSARIVLPEIAGDPADWKPGSEAIGQLQTADLVLLNGAGYESWLSWVTLPDDLLVDTSAGFIDRLIPLSEETVHQHGPGGEHSHTGTAFTVWLDPALAIEQARAIEKAISKMVPANAPKHQGGLNALSSNLEELDKNLAKVFDNFSEQPLLFSHPVYQYLEARYSLNGASLHWEPEEIPSTSAWIDLQNILRSHPARLMIWEDNPVDATATQLRQLGINGLTFDTASNLPTDGDYLDVMAANLERLQLQCCGTTIGHSE